MRCRASAGASSISASLLLLPLFLFLLVVDHASPVTAKASPSSTLQRERRMYAPVYDCQRCSDTQDQNNISSTTLPDGKDIDIIVTYSDSSGAVQVRSVRSRDLSNSWVWKSPSDDHHVQRSSLMVQDSFQPKMSSRNTDENSSDDRKLGEELPETPASPVHPVKLKRKMLRRERREKRTADLIKQDKEIDNQMQEAAIERARELDTTIRGKYNIWRKEYENPNTDSTVKLMRDQIIMARAYATIANAKNESVLYDSLIKHSRESERAIAEATTDIELHPRALDQAKAMGHILATENDQFYDCITIARKLRVMLQSSETNVNSLKKKSTFLIQLAAKTVPRPLHCIPLVLTTDYHLNNYEEAKFPNKEKLENTSLYHYARFSDNVVATSVVVNSTVLHAEEPERHVFHKVRDKLNFDAMKMWFLGNGLVGATIQVQNVDEFTWLNSSYCPVLHQLESARMIAYYFKHINHHRLLLDLTIPKYLSMLNHLRFYLPEVYTKLDKILFLDDDIDVRKDLAPLWSIDMKGMVNGAV